MSAREAILHATLRVIGEGGVAGLTNRRIVAEAGVSLGSLTYHFPTQTELLRQAMLRFAEQETTHLADVIASYSGADMTVETAADAVRTVIERMSFGNDDIAPLELYLQAGRDADLRESTMRCFAAYDELATTVLRALGAPDPQRLVEPVVALIAGSQLRRLATGATSARPVAEGLTMLVRGAER